MQYAPEKAHYVVVTGIIVKNGKYLIAQGSPGDKIVPDSWRVPGGKVETLDYQSRKPDVLEKGSPVWYNIVETVLEREVKEEVGIKIKNIRYVTSIVFIRPDKIPTVIISLTANYASGKVKLNEDFIDHVWVTLKEAKKYNLLAGIYEEIEMADKLLKGKKVSSWKKK